jgi:hypothetical protein
LLRIGTGNQGADNVPEAHTGRGWCSHRSMWMLDTPLSALQEICPILHHLRSRLKVERVVVGSVLASPLNPWPVMTLLYPIRLNASRIVLLLMVFRWSISPGKSSSPLPVMKRSNSRSSSVSEALWAGQVASLISHTTAESLIESLIRETNVLYENFSL